MIKLLLQFILAPILVLLGLTELMLPKGIDRRNEFYFRELPFEHAEISLLRDEKRFDQNLFNEFVPRFRASNGRRVVVLTSGWGYIHYDHDDRFNLKPVVIPVSQKYQSDFASIPWIGRWLINPFGWHAEAALIHDWLYAIGEKGKRKQADIIFYSAMQRQGVSWPKRRLMYIAVRAFGGAAYGKQMEWNNGFYEPYVSAKIPRDCIIDKPASLDSFRIDGRTRESVRYLSKIDSASEIVTRNIEAAQFLREGKHYFSEEWRTKFEQSECRAFLLNAVIDRYSQRYRLDKAERILHEQEFAESLPIAEWLEKHLSEREDESTPLKDTLLQQLEPLILEFIAADTQFEFQQQRNDTMEIVSESISLARVNKEID